VNGAVRVSGVVGAETDVLTIVAVHHSDHGQFVDVRAVLASHGRRSQSGAAAAAAATSVWIGHDDEPFTVEYDDWSVIAAARLMVDSLQPLRTTIPGQ